MVKEWDFFIDILENEEDWERQYYAISRLKNFHEKQVAQKLVPFLEHEKPTLRYITAKALGEIGDVSVGEALIKALVEPEDWVKIEIIEAIGKLNPVGAANMLVKYLEDERDQKVKATIIKNLGRLGDENIIPFITEYLNSVDERVKANAIEALENFSNTRILEILNPFKNDENNRIRANTALVLVRKGEDEGYNILREMLSENSEWMKASAVYALGEIGNSEALNMLIENRLFNLDKWSIKRNIMIALAKMINNDIKEAEEFFKGYIYSNTEKEAIFAVETISKYKLKNFLPTLSSRLSVARGELREKIEEALDTVLDVK